MSRDSEQAIVVVVHPIEIEPENRLGERPNRREGQELCAAEILHAGAAGEFPVARPLIVAADIADDVWMDSGERGRHLDAGILDTRQHAPRGVRVEGVVELENVVEGRRPGRPVRDRLGDCRLPGDGRDRAAFLAVEICLKPEVPAGDIERRPALRGSVGGRAGDAGIERDGIADIHRQREIDSEGLPGWQGYAGRKRAAIGKRKRLERAKQRRTAEADRQRAGRHGCVTCSQIEIDVRRRVCRSAAVVVAILAERGSAEAQADQTGRDKPRKEEAQCDG